MSLPSDATERKALPICTGVLDYFPRALAAVAACSKKGNDQHNPGQPLHWAKEKSTDHADCIVRHLLDRGTVDSDGILHSTKVAWRALALLEIELEKEIRAPVSVVCRGQSFDLADFDPPLAVSPIPKSWRVPAGVRLSSGGKRPTSDRSKT